LTFARNIGDNLGAAADNMFLVSLGGDCAMAFARDHCYAVALAEAGRMLAELVTAGQG
jgi:hypothetical protein